MSKLDVFNKVNFAKTNCWPLLKPEHSAECRNTPKLETWVFKCVSIHLVLVESLFCDLPFNQPRASLPWLDYASGCSPLSCQRSDMKHWFWTRAAYLDLDGKECKKCMSRDERKRKKKSSAEPNNIYDLKAFLAIKIILFTYFVL